MSIVATIAVVVLQLGRFGLVLVPWELSSQSLALGQKPVWLQLLGFQIICHGCKLSLTSPVSLPPTPIILNSVLGFFWLVTTLHTVLDWNYLEAAHTWVIVQVSFE